MGSTATWHDKFNWRAEDYFDDPRTIELSRAIEANDLVTMDRLIAAGADVNAQGKGKMTPLLWAFPDNRLERFRHLLQHGANPNVLFESDFGTRGALQPGEAVTHLAAVTNFPGYFEAVFERGGDPNLAKQTLALGRGDTPLFCVIQSSAPNREQRIQWLVAHGANLDHINGSEMTPAMLAVGYGGQYRLAWQLLQAGADPTIYAQSRSNQRLIHLTLADGDARSATWSPQQKADYGVLVQWLEQQGESVAAARQDQARWKSWSVSLGEFRRKMDAEVSARKARAQPGP
ncbi:MAG: hypothetical protein JNG90_11870 [Planctomycetaceae bacterium]|nr:hypothetical protein [Planctomycetaceae bacterium]